MNTYKLQEVSKMITQCLKKSSINCSKKGLRKSEEFLCNALM